jgi:hypothetical protein
MQKVACRRVLLSMCPVLAAAVMIAGEGAYCARAADPPKPAPLKITPGKVIVPTDAMRRIWGELISLDLKTRTGTFRKEGDDTVMAFTVVPYAELLHHATNGDLQDYRVGERAIFRLHENDQGEWVWLTYIQDEMNFLNGHKEYYHVDRIDADKKQLEVTDANEDKSYVRTTGILLETAGFADIKLGDKLRTKTHGVGKGARRVCWEVFLDDASLQKFRNEQMAVHRQRMLAEGLTSYVDSREGSQIVLTMFRETSDFKDKLKVGGTVQAAPAGVDRKPIADRITGKVSKNEVVRGLTQVTIQLDASAHAFQPTMVARVWVGD